MPYSSNTKRKKIIAEGKSLFWKYGFKRVTIEEICSAASVSKMTYYKFFANKMELIKTILDEVLNESIGQYRAIMDSDLPFTHKIKAQIEMKMQGTSNISTEFMNDLILHAEPEIMAYYSAMTQRVLKMVHDDYGEAQKKGEIRKDLKPEFISYFLNHIFEMLGDEKLVRMYKNPNELAMELIKFFFYGIMDHNNASNE